MYCCYLPNGIVSIAFLSTSSPSFAVMSDATQPGATAFTCKKVGIRLTSYVFMCQIQEKGISIFCQDTTYIDVSAAILPRHGLGQPNHPGFGSTVVGLSNIANDPGNGCDVYDPSLGRNKKLKKVP